MNIENVAPSLAFKFAERFSVKAFGLIVNIFLARLISPEEFGTVAIITVFINICQTFVDSGLHTALVQSKYVEKNDYSTVFFISFCVAILLSILLSLSAPLIGAFYQNDGIALPLRIYSFSLLFSSLGTVQNSKLQREMKFRTVLYTSLLSTFLSGVTGIVLALNGAGLWALVAYHFSYTVFSSVLILVFDRWFPNFVFSLSRAKELFSYGYKILISGVLCTIYNDVRTLIIGKMFSEVQLGYYNRGQQLPEVVLTTLDSSVQTVMLPVISEVQDDKERVAFLFNRMLSLNCLVTLPILIGLAATAESIIILLFTSKWSSAVLFMQIMCLGNLATPIVTSVLVTLKAVGRSDVTLKVELVRRIAMIVVLLISVFGFKTLEAIAWGFVVSSFFDVVIVFFFMRNSVKISFDGFVRDLWKIVLSSVVMWWVTTLVELVCVPTWVLLSIQILVGVLVYVLMCFLLRIESFKILLEIITNRIKSKFRKIS